MSPQLVAQRSLLDQFAATTLTLVRVTIADEQRAEQILRQYQDKRFSYTDATSFALMERLGIRTAFAFDRNFAQYGFSVLGVTAFQDR